MCEFPSWIQTPDGKVHFLVDKDVKACVENGQFKNWEDAIGHNAIEKVLGVEGEHQVRVDPPLEVLRAMALGKMNRMAKAGGYAGVFVDGLHEVAKGKWLCYGRAIVKASGSSKVAAYDSSEVWAFDSSEVWASGSSKVAAYDSSEVWASGSSEVEAYDSSKVKASGSSKVTAYDSSASIIDNRKAAL